MQSRQVLTMAVDQVRAAPSRLDDGEAVAPGWQATVHRVAAGQLLWLDLRAGQWLEVRAGALTLQQDAAFASLDARWAMDGSGEGEVPLHTHLPSGEAMCVRVTGRCAVRASESGELRLVVWQPQSSWQRLMRRLSQSGAWGGRLFV